MLPEINDPQLLPHVPMPVVTVPAETSQGGEDENAPAEPVAMTTRVLHIVNGEHFSGAERVQSHLGRCLPKFGVACDFACVKPGKFASLLDEHQGAWGHGYQTPMTSRFDLRTAWKIRALAKEHHYHLLHAHTPRTAMIASLASRLCGLPWVYHVHSPAGRDSNKQLSNRINASIERWSLRNCSHLVTVSESLRLDCIAGGAGEECVTVVHNGVPAIRPSRNSTPNPGGKWVLGMVALMRPRKGLEVVLDALAELEAEEHDLVLRVIGPYETQEYEAEINRRIIHLGIGHRVERVGFTNDVPAELAKLDALVLPSLFGEGLPMVVLEAMAAALPVIATRVEGTPEAVTDGVEGLLAQPRDANSLATKIRDLISGKHDWKQMAEAACTRHHKDFSDLAMARGTAAVYRRVLGS